MVKTHKTKKTTKEIQLSVRCPKCETEIKKKFRSFRRKKIIKCDNCNKLFYMSKRDFERLQERLDKICKSTKTKIK